MLVLGIDEAGRGPLVGSMFIAGVWAPKEVAKSWLLSGLKDSKKLKRDKRDLLAEQIKKECSYCKVLEFLPAEIDETNIDHLEFIAMLDLISRVAGPLEVIIDCPGYKKSWWKAFSDVIPEKMKYLKLEHKADEKFAIVSAASVLAKSARDFHIDFLGVPNGGYSGEKLTRFIEAEVIKTGRLPVYVRKSWANAAKFNREAQ